MSAYPFGKHEKLRKFLLSKGCDLGYNRDGSWFLAERMGNVPLEWLEEYLRFKVDNITEEEIERSLPVYRNSEMKYNYDNEKRQDGIKWYKRQLLR